MGSLTILFTLAVYLLARWLILPRARRGRSGFGKTTRDDEARWEKLQMQAKAAPFTGMLDTVVLDGIPIRIYPNTETRAGGVDIHTTKTTTIDPKHDWHHDPRLAESFETLARWKDRARLISNASGIRITLRGAPSGPDVHEACRILVALVQCSGASPFPYR